MFARMTISFLLGLIIASSWWCTMLFDRCPPNVQKVMWSIPWVSTVLLILVTLVAVSDHWDDGMHEGHT